MSTVCVAYGRPSFGPSSGCLMPCLPSYSYATAACVPYVGFMRCLLHVLAELCVSACYVVCVCMPSSGYLLYVCSSCLWTSGCISAVFLN